MGGVFMKKLKVGIVGVSRGDTYNNIFGKVNRSEVTAICDINSKNLEKAAKEVGLKDSGLYDNFDDFINSDIDIVVIGTPIPVHAEQAVKALEMNKHVFSEVTVSNTIEGCQAILNATKKSKGKYMLAENYIYLHYIQQWKKYIERGRIGRIHYAEAEYVHEIRNLLFNKETGETYWRIYRPPIHYCTHCLGPILYLMDDYIVKATAAGNKSTMVTDYWPSTIDMQVALFETKQGRIIKILRSQVTPREPHIVTYVVYGDKGFLETGRTPGYDTVGLRYFEGMDKTTKHIACYGTDLDAPEEARLGGHGTSDYYIADAFLTAIENDTKPPIDIVRALDMTIPGLVAHEAAVKGNVWLDVPRLV
jgi:predicted dehydrogenase